MNLPFLIRTDADYQRALALVDALWDAAPGTPEAQVLEVQAHLIDEYERATSTLGPADPIQLLQFKLKELGWSQRELARRLGWGGGRVSEVFSGKRPLTLRMVEQLSRVLELPPGLLVHDTRDELLAELAASVRMSPVSDAFPSGTLAQRARVELKVA